MAGVYGLINSRVDYYRVLDDALATADRYLSVGPHSVYEEIKRQLSFMKAASANNREPRDAEKDQVNVGLIAVRELKEGNPGDADLDHWASQLSALSSYFEGWPSDKMAGSGPESELDRVSLQRAMRKYLPQRP